MDTRNDGSWELCFSVPDVYLPQGYHFGMTAATGDLADNHDIISFKVLTFLYSYRIGLLSSLDPFFDCPICRI